MRSCPIWGPAGGDAGLPGDDRPVHRGALESTRPGSALAAERTTTRHDRATNPGVECHRLTGAAGRHRPQKTLFSPNIRAKSQGSRMPKYESPDSGRTLVSPKVVERTDFELARIFDNQIAGWALMPGGRGGTDGATAGQAFPGRRFACNKSVSARGMRNTARRTGAAAVAGVFGKHVDAGRRQGLGGSKKSRLRGGQRCWAK